MAVTAAGVLMALASSCVGTPAPGEQRAREDLEHVRRAYRPGDAKPDLPALAAASSLDDYLRFAVFKNPRVEAAYYAWAASVEGITVARSRPDPRLTFEADITRMLEALMPGLMMDFPGPGKLAAAGAAAAEESQASYFGFEQAILRTAVAVKTAYYRLHFLEENLRVQRETLTLLQNLEQLAQQQNAAGRVTLQDVLRAQIERDQVSTQIENLEDSRLPLLAELKAALGLRPTDPDPPVPTTFESSPEAESADALLQTALLRNHAALGADGETTPTGVEGKFTCPMHPQVLQDAAGACPSCGMPLEQVPGAPATATPVDPAATPKFQCPMKCEGEKTYAQPGKCPVCEMVLEAGQPVVAVNGPLAIPKSAVLDSGMRKLVYVEKSKGLFEPRQVTLGPSAGAFYPVRAGLTEGERVVTRGNFLIDSQFQINGDPSLLYPGGLHASMGHQHGGTTTPTAPGKAAPVKPAADAKPDEHAGHKR